MENIGNSNKTYRIRTNVGGADNKVDVQLSQHFDILEILSLKIKPTNFYQLQQSNYGVVVGRVMANGGFGVPNAKVSVFIPMKDGASLEQFYRYSYTSTNDMHNGIRYNILPDEVDSACHQDVGTLPSKTYMLDNDVMMEVFADYYKLTTSTNASGDYMIFGVPTGNQQIHMDVDLSDIGLLSQTPRDMMYKGYNLNLFDSPTKFKSGTDLDSLPQIQSQTKAIYVYPYWGETNELQDNIAITRCDIKLAYEFEPTCVFLGSAVTDRASNAIGKKCIATDDCGKMSELTASEGSIEMIRYNINGNIEEYPIMGNRLIDGDGVWCYQIPMNLDYVTTDEFGNTVPTDDPTKGIPTRAKVRFRIAMDDTGNEGVGRKKARYLIPHNPKTNKDVDYSFGTYTKEENFVDLLWNKVYSVKNYIPRIEKSRKASRKRISKTREHTGIKGVNHSGENNPIPYNNITLKLNFAYKFRCILLKSIIMFMVAFNTLSWFINMTLANAIIRPITTVLKGISYVIPGGSNIREKIEKIETATQIPYVSLDSEFCMLDEEKPILYVPIAVETSGVKQRVAEETAFKEAEAEYGSCKIVIVKASNFEETELSTCIETQLAEENEVVFFNFYNDWLNGNLYFPLWFRRLRKPRKILFGLFTTRGIDRWCQDTKTYRITQRETCDESGAMKVGTPSSKISDNSDFKRYTTRYTNAAYNKKGHSGLVHTEKTMLDELVYYYNANWFKTDVILLGSLDDYDRNGIPQFFKYLPITTYQKPNAVRTTDADDDSVIEMSGENWSLDREGPDYYRTGLFYQLGCLDAHTLMLNKTCFNVKRVCELGVDLDQRNMEEDGSVLEADGLITNKEIANHDIRAMFATMNDYTDENPRLSVARNDDSSMMEYQLLYSYGKEFDGINWGERIATNKSYRTFRGGYDDGGVDVTDRKNSFYFYFGLHEGKTAIEKFNSQYFSDCGSSVLEEKCQISIKVSEWCEENKENSMTLNLEKTLDYPLTVTINEVGDEDNIETFTINEKDFTKSNKSASHYQWVYENDKYGDFAVTVSDVEGLVIYSDVVNLYPDKIRAGVKALPFNVKQELLAAILSNTIKDGSKITYNNGVVYGNGAVFGVKGGSDYNGCASRMVTVSGKTCEIGGSVALTLPEGYDFNDTVITVHAEFSVDGNAYVYNKTYDNTNRPIIRQMTETDNDGSVTTTDVACIYVPYGDVTYDISVEHRCANGVVNTVANSWSGKVKVGSYTAPIVTFHGSDGYSLTLEQVKGVLNIFGTDVAWGDIIDGGGILDLPVNDDNTYLQQLYDIYADESDPKYDLLSSIVELQEKTVIESTMTDEEKEEAEKDNLNADEINKGYFRDLLYSFYNVFTRTSEDDGLTITCNNNLTDIKVTNFHCRKKVDGLVIYSTNPLEVDNDQFNGVYGDFSLGEALLYGYTAADGVNHKYATHKSSDYFKCVVNDLLHGGSEEVSFHLFDKRMKVEVFINDNIYKYKDGSEVEVEKTYRGWMSIHIENGFKGYQVLNDMYDNWTYEDGYLFPVDGDGNPIEADLVIQNDMFGNKAKHRFNLPSSYDGSSLIIQDGNYKIATISHASSTGECGLGFGGLLTYSQEHISKNEMKDEYGSYTPKADKVNGWRSCSLVYGGEKVNVTNMSVDDIGSLESHTFTTENGLAVKGYFINYKNYTDISMMVYVTWEDKDDDNSYVLSKVHNVAYCDKVSFEAKEINLNASVGMKKADGVSFPLQREDVDYGYYYTWGVTYGKNSEDEWEKCFNVKEAAQGFYIDNSHRSEGDYFLAQYDEGEEIEDVPQLGANVPDGNTSDIAYNESDNQPEGYKFLIVKPSSKMDAKRVHWIQDMKAVYHSMWTNLNMEGSGHPASGFRYQGWTRDGECIFAPKEANKLVPTRFIWMNFNDSPMNGIPRQTDDLGMVNNAFDILGVLLTTGKVVGRYIVKEVQ